jgi:hypothetical protein
MASTTSPHLAAAEDSIDPTTVDLEVDEVDLYIERRK